jgi:hypothetical protein
MSSPRILQSFPEFKTFVLKKVLKRFQKKVFFRQKFEKQQQ